MILKRMKMGHIAVSDIESSSVTLKTWRKEPEENTVILLSYQVSRRKD